MKHIILFFILCFTGLVTSDLYSQCPTQTLIITNQADIDNFATNYPNCVDMMNSGIVLQGNGILNLTGFTGLKSVNHVVLSGTPNVTSLNGLHELENINENLIFIDVNIPDLDELQNLVFLKYLNVSSCLLITDISLPNIQFAEFIEIGPCESLQSVSFDNIEYMSLSSISEYTISIYGSDNLQSVSFPKLQQTEGTIFVTQQQIGSTLNNFNFGQLTSIGDNLFFVNLSIQDMSGFPSLSTINGSMIIHSCNSLTTLNGLENLTAVGEIIDLNTNANLEFCSVEGVCNHIEMGFTTEIFFNGSGCNNEAEILEQCNILPDCNETDYQIISTTPTACPPDTLQPDVCLNVCPYTPQVYTIPNAKGNIEWTVLGAESYEVIGNECIVNWGGPGSGLVSAKSVTDECEFYITIVENGALSYTFQVDGYTGPYTYNWSGPNGFSATSPNVQFPAEGYYVLEITDSQGCVETKPYNVPFNFQPDCENEIQIFASVSNPNCGGNNGAIDISILNGQSPYTYEWSDGNTTEDIFGISSGYYNVTVTDFNGCTSVKTIEVDCDCAGTEMVIADIVFCDELSALNVSVLSPEQIISITILGPNNFVSNSVENDFLEPGLYEVYIESTGCNYLRTVDVQPNQNWGITPIINNESTCGACDGSIDLTDFIGFFSFIGWSTGQTTNSIQGLCAGFYTAHFDSPSGGVCSVEYEIICDVEEECPFDLSVCVDILEEIEANIITVPETINEEVNICAGQTVYFESQSPNAETHVWDFGNGESAAGNTTEFTYEVAGSYLVQLIARNECLCADTATVNIIVEQAIIPKLDCVGTVCENTEVTYTTDASCSSYTWEVTGDGVVTSGGGNTDDFITIDWGVGPLGTIALSVDNCTENYCIFENITQIPIIGNNDFIKGKEEVCKGALEVYTITNYGGADFNWEVSSYGQIVNGQGTNTVSIQWTDLAIPSNPQWVRVSYENCYLECSGSDELEVIVLDEYFFSGPIEICQNGIATYTAEQLSGGQAMVDWELRDQTGTVVFSQDASTQFNFTANAPTGSYTLHATPTNGADFCSDNYQSFINILSIPPPVSNIEGTTEICLGQNYTYEANTTSTSTSLSWQVNDGGNTLAKQGRVINVIWNSAGPYSLEVVQIDNADAACESSPIQLDLNAIEPLQILGDPDHCVESVSTFTTTSFDDISYEWVVTPASAATIVSGQNTNTVEFFWHSAGNFSVSLNACGFSDTYAVLIHPATIPSVNHPIEICPSQTATIATTAAFSSYEWKNENGLVISNNAQTDVGPGYYELIVTDEKGCKGNTIFNIDPIPIPEIEISSPNLTTYCPGVFPVPVLYAMIANPPFDYQWYRNGTPISGATNALYTPPSGESGIYTVEATNQEGCSAFSSQINVISSCVPGTGPPPEIQCVGVDVSFDIENTALCNQHNFSNTSPNSIPGTVNWSFGFPDIEGTAIGENVSYEYQRAGYYMVLMLAQHNTNGIVENCGVLQLDLVPVAPNFTVLPGCVGEPLQFEDLSTHISGDGVESWAWDFDDGSSGPNNSSTLQNPIHQYNNPGTYNVSLTITSENDCESTITKIVEVQDHPTPSFDLPTADCQSVPLNFIANVGSNVIDVEWDFGDPSSGDANISNVIDTYHEFATPGTYTIRLTARTVYGCEDTWFQQVTVQPNTLSGLMSMEPASPICEGTSTTITAPSGGQNYNWSTMENGPTIEASEAGTYEVTITDSNGCLYSPPPIVLDILPVPDGEIRVVEFDEYGQPIVFYYDSYTICEGENVFLEINEVDGYSYTWSNGQSGTSIEYSLDRDNILQEGTYEFDVIITDVSSGCTNQVGPFTVEVNAQPDPINLISDPEGFICDSNPVTISITNYNSDLTYIWNTGTIDATSLVVDVPGIYYVRGVNANGCQTTSNVIEVNKGPDISRIPSGCRKQCTPDTLCLPNMPTIVSWQWFFNDVAIPAPEGTVDEIVATESGDYYVEMLDQFGCTAISGIMSLDLFIGLGTINGAIYFDVNENGVIDGPDTLMSNQTIFIEGDNYNSLAYSDINGIYTFNDIESVDYNLYFDSLSLPNGWSVIESIQQATLVGCDDETEVNWLVTNQCVAQFSTTTLEACTGNSVIYNSMTLSIDDVVDVLLFSELGCDSTVTVSVAEIFPTTEELTFQACEGTNYEYDGDQIPAGTSKDFQYQNVAGCDSTLTVHVEEVMMITENVMGEACTGSFYEFNDVQIPAGTSMDFDFVTTSGCDSIITVTVEETMSIEQTFPLSACEGTFIDFGGIDILAGETVVFNLQTSTGCDSTVTVVVEELTAYNIALSFEACTGEFYDYNGQQILAGETIVNNLNTSTGCDSIETITINQLLSSSTNLDLEICEGETMIYNGVEFEAGDAFDFELINSTGCDSIHSVNAIAVPLSYEEIELFVCGGDSILYQGEFLYPNSVQEITFQNFLGCDSIEQVTVQELGVVPMEISIELCPNETTAYNGQIYEVGDTEIFNFESFQGCDSIVELSIVGSPDFDFEYETEAICPDEMGSININLINGTSSTYLYSINGAEFQLENEFNNLLSGNHELYVQDENGCIKTIAASIPAYDNLIILAEDKALTCEIDSIELNAELIAGPDLDLEYIWPDGTTGNAFFANEPGTYLLQASNICEQKNYPITVFPPVTVLENYLFVPNVFSPNEDGHNDYLILSPSADVIIHDFEINIFSRWGEALYTSKDISVGWDGKMNDGNFNPGVHVWYVTMDVTYCGQRLEVFEKGDITVIR